MRLRLVVLLRSRSVPLVGCVAQLKYGALRAALEGRRNTSNYAGLHKPSSLAPVAVLSPLARTHSSPSILSSHLCDFL